MTLDEIRSRYLAFMEARGHTVIPSSRLVPENDPTTLFTGSGMQQLMPYLLGKSHPEGSRLTDSQKCFRSGDIEEVGDNRHTTFFEMLGNWSLGDYFKHEQLPWFFEFLTNGDDAPESSRGIGLDPHKLYVTVFIGDTTNNIPKDTESVELWKANFAKKGIDARVKEIGSEENGYKVGMHTESGEEARIFYYDAKKNWWSRAGTPDKMPAGEPGGPDSEVFYRFDDSEHTSEEKQKWGEHCHPNCDCGRFLEIGNSVFMQYLKNADGTFSLLPKQNVDFGGGLERLAAVSTNTSDVFLINAFDEARQAIESATQQIYSDHKREFRVILDHIRAAVFLIGDGILPDKTDRGYFVRRLIRRAVRYSDKLGITKGYELVMSKDGGTLDLKKSVLATAADAFITHYARVYPDLEEQRVAIRVAIATEEKHFRDTLSRGVKELARFASDGSISAHDAFQLVTTYGFPLELVIEEAGERGIKQIDMEGFKELLKAHQELSRAGSEQKFKGGLADASEATTRLHTAHHLLLKALQTVLGKHVKQRGSNITQERLRIDFSHGEKVTKEQLAEVEQLVNEAIATDFPVIHSELPKEVAEGLGAEHEFGAKYPDRVSVYSVGPKDATKDSPRYEQAFSMEFCDGPHVEHTGELADGNKHFVILKEEAVSAGIRRIKAVLQ